MSVVHYHRCDHCGKRLDEIKDYVGVRIDEYERIEADLCAECYEGLNALIDEYLHKEGE